MTVEDAGEMRELTELLYALSHDLGAPLRVIGGFSKTLLDELQNEQQGGLPGIGGHTFVLLHHIFDLKDRSDPAGRYDP
jgi:signal transduction histidine kinase